MHAMLQAPESSNKVKFVNLQLSEGKLVTASDKEDSPLLRARTLLAFLNGRNQLEYTTTGGLVFVRPLGKTMSYMLMNNIALDLKSDDVAAIGIIPFNVIHKQPAFAVYKAQAEVHDAFVNVWLKSSMSWLDKNPVARVRLELEYPL